MGGEVENQEMGGGGKFVGKTGFLDFYESENLRKHDFAFSPGI